MILTSWQDVFFATVQVYFIVALVPQMRARPEHMPVLHSSIPITLGLLALCIPQASYENWFAVATSAIHALQWGYLAYARWPYVA